MSDSVTHKTIADGATGTVPAASTALAAADDAARHYANRSRSDSTWRAYEADWRQFISWCADTGSTPLPASAQTAARFLAIQASPCPKRPRGLAPATLKRRLAAIRLMHLGAELPSPHIAPEVNEVLRGIVNAHRDTAGQQKRPLLDEDICRMVDTLNGNTLRALRDRAVLLLGFAGARRSLRWMSTIWSKEPMGYW